MWGEMMKHRLRQMRIDNARRNIDLSETFIRIHEGLDSEIYTPSKVTQWRYLNNTKMLAMYFDNKKSLTAHRDSVKREQMRLAKMYNEVLTNG